jgi:NAD(P)-dependent dehydrogenase (short-subunit alcohol dehydrogenase family)
MAAPDAPTPTVDLFSVAGKTVVVTGGTRGIGRMIAGGFVAGGATVIVSSRKADACAETAAALSEVGTCTAIPADLSTEDGARGLAEAVAADHDRVDVLVNNAGATWGAPLAEHDHASWSRVLDLNVEGIFHTTKFLLPLLQAAGTADDPARVINIGSIAGTKVSKGDTYSYMASKAALHHLTAALAAKLATSHITVNALAPGPMAGGMMRRTVEDAEFRKAIENTIPLGRTGDALDMIGVTNFLCSRAGAYMTGAVIPLDGGSAACR